jgi:hypothetical protein
MRRYILTVMLVMVTIAGAQAQRMLPGQKGLEVTTGILSNKMPVKDYYINIAMTLFGKKGHYGLGALEYGHEYALYRDLHLPVETYLAEGGYSLQLLGDIRKMITLNAALTGVAGYETFNRGKKLLPDGAIIRNKDGFIYGAGGRLSLETYLSDRFVLLLQGRARLLWGTSREQFRPSAGLGLRFNF